MSVVDLWGEPVEKIDKVETTPKGNFVILAGINKRTERQLYLSTFNDCDEWSISVVPSAMSYSRAQYMIAKAKQDIEAKTKQGKTPQYPPFVIANLEDSPLDSMTRRILV